MTFNTHYSDPKLAPKQRYHSSDGWRGYAIPARAIVGASDTGMAPDSPAPSLQVQAELDRFRDEVLAPAGIHARERTSQSSNVLMVKRWLVVSPKDFAQAAQLAVDADLRSYRYLHTADLEQLGYEPGEEAAA